MRSCGKDLNVLVPEALSVDNSVDICPMRRSGGSGEHFRVVACRFRCVFLDQY